jgi:hypothetical protein
MARVGAQCHMKKKKFTQVINTMVSETEIVTLSIPTPEVGKILTFQNKHPARTNTHTHTHTLSPLTCLFNLPRECCLSYISSSISHA